VPARCWPPSRPASFSPTGQAIQLRSPTRSSRCGICLGHQLLARALGLETFKLKFGHRGVNHPVKDLRSGAIEITTQNHGFAVRDTQVPRGTEITHVNLNDGTVEGLACPSRHAFSVQFHPEASPGPHDSRYLFALFRDDIARFAGES
jgi:carbamoyl-phosphate synthase small subunit